MVMELMESNNEEIKCNNSLIRNKKELIILIALALSFYNCFCAFSMIAPIFPLEVAKFNIGTSISGQIFAAYPLTIFLLSPFVGKWMPKLGVRFCLIAGGITSGISNILFGFVGDLGRIFGDTWFVVFCFIFRISMAVGAAFNETAAFSILMITFKHKLSTAQGIMSMFEGLGSMTGPAIGSLLFAINKDFHVPFFVIGGIVLVVILTVSIILPSESSFRQEEDDIGKEPGNFMKIFLVPGVLVIATSTVTVGMVESFLEPTLTNYVKLINPDFSVVENGLLFMYAAVMITISTPILGLMIDRKVIPGRHAIIVGAFNGALSYLMLAPSPLLTFVKPNIAYTITALIALGALCVPAMFVPVLTDMQMSARNAGLPMNLATDSILAGILTSSYYVGDIIGASLGSVLTDHFGFQWASTILAIILLLEGVLILVFTLWEDKYRPNYVGFEPNSTQMRGKITSLESYWIE